MAVHLSRHKWPTLTNPTPFIGVIPTTAGGATPFNGALEGLITGDVLSASYLDTDGSAR